MILCNFKKDKGRFLLWTWEHWSVGGGSSVQWYFMSKAIYPSKYFIGWLFLRIDK